MSDELWIMVIFGAAGMLIVILGLPLLLRKVRPNMLYGCRTKRSLSDPAIWYEVNARCGRNLIVAGSCVAIFGALSMVLGPVIGSDLATALMVVLLVFAVVVACVHADRSYRT